MDKGSEHKTSSALPLAERVKLQKHIGEGGFARVYRAALDGHPVALKCLLAQHANEQHTGKLRPAAMLQREGLVMKACSTCKYIVKCYEVLEVPPDLPGLTERYEAPFAALALEYVEGGTVAQLLRKQMVSVAQKVYSDLDALRWSLDLARALLHLHTASPPVIHRDVKMENVLLGFDKEEGRLIAKLTDFGLHVKVLPDESRRRMLRRRTRSIRAGSTAGISLSSSAAALAARSSPGQRDPTSVSSSDNSAGTTTTLQPAFDMLGTHTCSTPHAANAHAGRGEQLDTDPSSGSDMIPCSMLPLTPGSSLSTGMKVIRRSDALGGTLRASHSNLAGVLPSSTKAQPQHRLSRNTSQQDMPNGAVLGLRHVTRPSRAGGTVRPASDASILTIGKRSSSFSAISTPSPSQAMGPRSVGAAIMGKIVSSSSAGMLITTTVSQGIMQPCLMDVHKVTGSAEEALLATPYIFSVKEEEGSGHGESAALYALQAATAAAAAGSPDSTGAVASAISQCARRRSVNDSRNCGRLIAASSDRAVACEHAELAAGSAAAAEWSLSGFHRRHNTTCALTLALTARPIAESSVGAAGAGLITASAMAGQSFGRVRTHTLLAACDNGDIVRLMTEPATQTNIRTHVCSYSCSCEVDEEVMHTEACSVEGSSARASSVSSAVKNACGTRPNSDTPLVAPSGLCAAPMQDASLAMSLAIVVASIGHEDAEQMGGAAVISASATPQDIDILSLTETGVLAKPVPRAEGPEADAMALQQQQAAAVRYSHAQQGRLHPSHAQAQGHVAVPSLDMDAPLPSPAAAAGVAAIDSLPMAADAVPAVQGSSTGTHMLTVHTPLAGAGLPPATHTRDAPCQSALTGGSDDLLTQSAVLQAAHLDASHSRGSASSSRPVGSSMGISLTGSRPGSLANMSTSLAFSDTRMTVGMKPPPPRARKQGFLEKLKKFPTSAGFNGSKPPRSVGGESTSAAVRGANFAAGFMSAIVPGSNARKHVHGVGAVASSPSTLRDCPGVGGSQLVQRALSRTFSLVGGRSGSGSGVGVEGSEASFSGASWWWDGEEMAEVFTLTGATGSALYMAPEVSRHQPYNDKIDVYSFGICMYELLGRTLLAYTHVGVRPPGHDTVVESAYEYARMAGAGFRPARIRSLPDAVWDLISAAWHDDPLERPPMSVIVERLQELVAETEMAEASAKAASCKCTIA